MKNMTISEARSRFMQLPDETGEGQIVAVTRRNKEVLAVMSWELYEGLLETLEVLSDPELMAQLKQGIQDIAAGRTATIEQARERLGV